MLRHGIVTRAGLEKPRTWLGARRHASLLLLRDLAAGAGSTTHYATIIRLIRMSNGTWRDTFEGRLAPLDERVAEIVGRRRWPAAPLRVVDVGASSGATSVEFYEAMRRTTSVDFVASDRWRDAFAVQPAGGGPTVILDGDGDPIQYVAGRFVLPGQGDEPWFYPVNRLLRRRVAARWLAAGRGAVAGRDLEHVGDFATCTVDGFEVTRLPMLSPACLRCVREQPDFRFEVADVLEPLPWRADVLRAVNILTPFHFAAAPLRRAMGNCLDAIAKGGLFVLGRSPSENVHELRATVYAKEDGRLRVLARTNGGCEVEDLVAEVAGDVAERSLDDADMRPESAAGSR